MKKVLVLILSVAISSLTFSQETINSLDNGLFNGEYRSHHDNGVIKAEGEFNGNRRVGTWKIYDESGILRVERQYIRGDLSSVNWFDAQGITLNLDVDLFVPQRGADGLYIYPYIEEADVAYSKRIWRELRPTRQNTSFFMENMLYDDMIEGIQSGTITAYTEDELQNEYTGSISDLEGLEVKGWRLKEDFYFDNARKQAFARVIAFSPIVELNGEEVTPFWVYYPHVREVFAEMKGREELIYFHMFNSTIVKVSNVQDLELNQQYDEAEMQEAILGLEIELIETEHDLWIEATN